MEYGFPLSGAYSFRLCRQPDEEDYMATIKNFPDILHFATDLVSACGIHHSFTRHSLISFFHNPTDYAIGVWYNRPLLEKSVHQLMACIVHRESPSEGDRQRYRAWFLLPGHFAVPVFPFFLLSAVSMSFMTNCFAMSALILYNAPFTLTEFYYYFTIFTIFRQLTNVICYCLNIISGK